MLEYSVYMHHSFRSFMKQEDTVSEGTWKFLITLNKCSLVYTNSSSQPAVTSSFMFTSSVPCKFCPMMSYCFIELWQSYIHEHEFQGIAPLQLKYSCMCSGCSELYKPIEHSLETSTHLAVSPLHECFVYEQQQFYNAMQAVKSHSFCREIWRYLH